MASNILGIDDHYLHWPKDSWGHTDLNNPDMVNPWLEIQEIVNPKRVIEIGMFAGHASLLMLNVFKNLETLVSYDDDKISALNYRQIKKYYSQHIFFNEPIWGNEHRHTDIDLIFIDGNHQSPIPTYDMESCLKIKPRYILMDNIELTGVREATRAVGLVKACKAYTIYNVKFEPKYFFYSNTKWSRECLCFSKSPGIMGLFKMEGNYDN